MEPGNTHLFKLTIAGLNALAVHAQELLLRRGIRIHIGTLDGDHGHTVACIELMTEWFTDVATISEENRTKWQGACQIINRGGVMWARWSQYKACRDARTITNEVEFPVEIAFVFGITSRVIIL